MKALIVLAHQKGEGSFCYALAQMARETLLEQGWEVIWKDLYAEHFDPVLTDEELSLPMDAVSGKLREEIAEVLEASLYVVIHPNWWGMPPAILKGWIDRVIRQGFCYAFTEKGPVRKLEGHRAVVFTTGNTPPEIETKVNGDPLENLWKNIVFKTVGVDDCVRLNFASVILSSPKQRQEWLEEAREVLLKKAVSSDVNV